PQCDGTAYQIQGWCLKNSTGQVVEALASTECKIMKASLVSTSTAIEVDMLMSMADKVQDDLWVASSSKVFRGSDSRDTSPLTSEDADLLDTGSGEKLSEDRECLLVSRTAGEIVIDSCSKIHRVACAQKVSVSPIFPSISNLKVNAADDRISLDWDAEQSGWKGIFKIFHQKTSQRYSRSIRFQTFTDPPVTVMGLQSGTSYTLEMEAELASGFVETSDPIVVNTTNGTEIKLGYTWQGQIGWASSSGYQLLHLICGFTLVVSCIATMLMFFSAGMFYQDCMAQLGFQATLMAAYFVLLLAHPSYVKEKNE
ncbi:unnamed protein product, partial [Meganyctiphanes norvegica]